MNKIDQTVTGVEACDLQAGDVVKTVSGMRLKVDSVCNMAGKTFVSFCNANGVSFRQDDRLDIERHIYA